MNAGTTTDAGETMEEGMAPEMDTGTAVEDAGMDGGDVLDAGADAGADAGEDAGVLDAGAEGRDEQP